MPPLPTGTVTFLFTDIEGSTNLLQHLGDADYAQALTDHSMLMRAAFAAHSGYELQDHGDGFLVVFSHGGDAVQAALESQRAINVHPWPRSVLVRVRMGLHTGQPLVTSTGYAGLDVHRAARICQAGWGGQILISEDTVLRWGDRLPAGVGLRDLGRHRLKDLRRPETLLQVLHADLPGEFPPLRTLDRMAQNLPVQLTSFIGRETEIVRVQQLLARTRLLTLTGPGGAGKTRLALQAAADVADTFADGVWLVELAPLSDPDLIPQTIASALGLREQPGRLILDTVSDFLRSRHLLLLLDNCEHLVASCAHLAEALLGACPSLRMLTTSREPLGIAAETAWQVPSFTLPDIMRLPAFDTLVNNEAIHLFAERAGAALPEFELTPQNGQAVAQVCARLDGIPLAIELAASCVTFLSPQEIVTRLDDRFRLLTDGSRTALPRQRTLRATLDWSHELLDVQERALLRRLAVFAGGFTLDAAEVVCGGRYIKRPDILTLLRRLVRKSLVIMVAHDGQSRYGLHETVRQYAVERLEEAEESAAVRSRHLAWCLALVEDAKPHLEGPEQVSWHDRLSADLDNLRAALEWGKQDRGSIESALHLVGTLWPFWLRGHIVEGRVWAEELLTLAPSLDNPVRARALNTAANLSMLQGDDSAVMRHGNEALRLSKVLGDPEIRGWALHNLSYAASVRGERGRDVSLLEEGQRLARDIGDDFMLEALLHALAVVVRPDNSDLAITYLEEALGMARKAGHLYIMVLLLMTLTDAHAGRGDYLRARFVSQEGLRLARKLQDHLLMAWLVRAAAYVSGRLGTPSNAAGLLGASDKALERLGVMADPADPQYAQSIREVEVLRKSMGEDGFHTAYQAGSALGLEDAVTLALEEAASVQT